MKITSAIFIAIQLLVLCITKFSFSSALPTPKSGQWTPNTNSKSRESRDSKDKEKDDNKRKYYWAKSTVATYYSED